VHHEPVGYDPHGTAEPEILENEKSFQEPALRGSTKQGDVYVLNRETGEPIIPVTSRSAQGTVEEDYAAAMQPISGLNFPASRN